ncbi:MAG: hypothetical protein H6618_09110 [Deltaproteobacteria bacterium]|nr:hypothetical protein [Deltaproteobacteria bacterium]
MKEATCNSVQLPQKTIRDALTEVLREGARKMLAQATEAEVSDSIERFRSVADEKEHNGVRKLAA